ncbi:hypothetical protein R1sor_013658 [Riccia sorocarpa]|uniref:Uncharacterized protein n=1 Tax=Riccia sorocarpa TaxID=122646 RepID=A0ABD3HDE7_9MARC
MIHYGNSRPELQRVSMEILFRLAMDSNIRNTIEATGSDDAEQEAPAAAEEGISSEPSEVKPEVGVECTILTSAAATKVRGISPCSTILSEREEDLRDLDVSLMDTSPVPRTRSKSGKRNLPKGDSVRKVRTKSHVTEAEMSTGIGTPCAHTKVVLKPLGEIETPEALKRMGDDSKFMNPKRKITI